MQQFLAVWREIEPLATAQGLSQHEVVTLASIVEKETGVPEERALVAGGLPQPPAAPDAARIGSHRDLRDP